MIKDDLKLAIQTAMNDKAMQKSIKKMHDLFTGEYLSIIIFLSCRFGLLNLALLTKLVFVNVSSS